MPYAAILDLIRSKQYQLEERKRIRVALETSLENFNKEWNQYLIAKGAITAGDSIEILTWHWLPLLCLLHRLLNCKIRFKVGIGVGSVQILSEYADECDGPAFWMAREALEIAKKENLPFLYRVDESADPGEKEGVKKFALAYMIILRMTKKQRIYCYEYLWNNKSVTEIAKMHSTTKSNVSIAINRSLCKILKITLSTENVDRG